MLDIINDWRIILAMLLVLFQFIIVALGFWVFLKQAHKDIKEHIDNKRLNEIQ